MTWSARVRSDEAGDTLIEVLFTVMVIGIAFAALIAGMTVTIVAADAHRRLSDTEVVTRDFGDAIKNLALHPVTTTLTTAIGGPSSATPHNPGDSITISVASTAGFSKTTAPGLEIDTEEFTVTNVVSSTSLTVTAGGSEGHNVGATVARYDPCPTIGQLTPTFTVPSSAQKIGTPTITAVTFYDQSNPPNIVPSAAEGSVACGGAVPADGYWDSSSVKPLPQTCSNGPTPTDHLTSCDPPIIGVTFSVTSTDSDTRRLATTSTQIFIRRGSA